MEITALSKEECKNFLKVTSLDNKQRFSRFNKAVGNETELNLQ